MARYKGTPPYAEFVEFGEAPYDDQPADVPVVCGPHTLFIDTSPLGQLGVSADEVLRWLPRNFAIRAPLVRRVTHRPLAAIQLDIDRATIPAIRPEDV